MNSLQIAQLLSTNNVTKPFFKGVFASDKLPSLNKTERLICRVLIANTDDSNGSGVHWVLFGFQSQERVMHTFLIHMEWSPNFTIQTF